MVTTTTTMPVPSHPLLDRLWRDYVKDVSYVRSFVDLYAQQHNKPFENDHIALRTLARAGEGSGLRVFVPVFERLGWRVKDAYVFPDVHLRAVYLAQAGLPRIFVSELDVEAVGGAAKTILLNSAPDPSAPEEIEDLARWFCAPPAPPARADVETVAKVSQYGAWLLCFGRRVNHFTACVDDVEAWQRKLKEAGVPMKAEIEGAPIAQGGVGLRQTATAAAGVEVTFRDGTKQQQPYAYFEIAERQGGFDGFLAAQARQLFDMTKQATSRG